MSNFVGKTTRVQTIRRAAPSQAAKQRNPNAIGNILINGKWFSGIELRNNLIGIDMPTDLPLSFLHGSTINYKELTITEEMLAAGSGVHVEKVNGRDIKYTRPGVANVELEVDWGTVNFSESTLMQCKIKALSADGRRISGGMRTVATAPAVVTPSTTEVIAPVETEGTPAPFPKTLTPDPVIDENSTEPIEEHIGEEAVDLTK